uniref:Uncharacterized protein n=1 Tax=Knipowitschia caucasica TaxID=637954 RepID=A0AAV2LDV7_KNICA
MAIRQVFSEDLTLSASVQHPPHFLYISDFSTPLVQSSNHKRLGKWLHATPKHISTLSHIPLTQQGSAPVRAPPNHTSASYPRASSHGSNKVHKNRLSFSLSPTASRSKSLSQLLPPLSPRVPLSYLSFRQLLLTTLKTPLTHTYDYHYPESMSHHRFLPYSIATTILQAGCFPLRSILSSLTSSPPKLTFFPLLIPCSINLAIENAYCLPRYGRILLLLPESTLIHRLPAISHHLITSSLIYEPVTDQPTYTLSSRVPASTKSLCSRHHDSSLISPPGACQALSPLIPQLLITTILPFPSQYSSSRHFHKNASRSSALPHLPRSYSAWFTNPSSCAALSPPHFFRPTPSRQSPSLPFINHLSTAAQGFTQPFSQTPSHPR